jgi:hypothetical protein
VTVPVPPYPVYVSPDGVHEQYATSPSHEVRLKFAGWHRAREPRKRKAGGDLSRWKKPATN